MPILNIYGTADHLVPPAATKPFNDLVGSEDKTLYEFQGGHIGVFVGSRSQKELAPAIAKWLIQRDAPATVKVAPVKAATAKAESAKVTEKPAEPEAVKATLMPKVAAKPAAAKKSPSNKPTKS
jgi:poly(3-hydroxyalkanoate) synthetase